jgi:hypothetical protein
METLSVYKLSCVPPAFNSDHSIFQPWWEQFQAYTHTQGYQVALEVGREKHLSEKEEEEVDKASMEGRRKYAAREHNYTVKAAFTMAFSSESTL